MKTRILFGILAAVMSLSALAQERSGLTGIYAGNAGALGGNPPSYYASTNNIIPVTTNNGVYTVGITNPFAFPSVASQGIYSNYYAYLQDGGKLFADSVLVSGVNISNVYLGYNSSSTYSGLIWSWTGSNVWYSGTKGISNNGSYFCLGTGLGTTALFTNATLYGVYKKTDGTATTQLVYPEIDHAIYNKAILNGTLAYIPPISSWVTGAYYTNNISRCYVSASIYLTGAADGAAIMQLLVYGATNVIQTGFLQLGYVCSGTNDTVRKCMQLSGVIPPGAYFTFTNTSTGSATATINSDFSWGQAVLQ